MTISIPMVLSFSGSPSVRKLKLNRIFRRFSTLTYDKSKVTAVVKKRAKAIVDIVAVESEELKVIKGKTLLPGIRRLMGLVGGQSNSKRLSL